MLVQAFKLIELLVLFWLLVLVLFYQKEGKEVKLVNCVVIRKTGGFYNVFDDDAIVVSYLTGYKIIGGRCGFPINGLDKVINLLENNNVDYIIKSNMGEEIIKNYKNKNKYSKILEKGKKKFDIDYKINDIITKLNMLSYDRLNNLLDVIEDYINE